MSLVEKARLSFYITHPNVQEIDVRVRAPMGTSFSMAISDLSDADYGSGTADVSRTTLDDDAVGVTIQTIPSPRVGTFKSRNGDQLTNLIGLTAEGTWTFIVKDFEATNLGTIFAASLYLTVGGIETRYDVAGLPASIPDDDLDGIELEFGPEIPLPDPDPDPPESADLSAYQVWITPLFLGVPGEDEFTIDGRSTITEEDLIEVTQFGDLDVKGKIGEGRIATFKIRTSEPVVANLIAFQFAVRIGFLRPLETQSEIIFWGQANLKKRFRARYVEIEAHDPLALKAKYHQVRRGDIALNVDPERGRITSDFYGMETILRAAHNTPEQQDRQMPCFAFPCAGKGDFPAVDPPLIGYERFTPVSNLVEQILKSVFGPDLDARPEWLLPAQQYGWMDCYDPPTDHTTPDPYLNLGRYLVPGDLDNPDPEEVIFNYGYGNGTAYDNCEDVEVDPERPATHVHYYDSHRVYRETAADVSSSANVGAWVDAVDAGFEIERPSTGMTADTRPLIYLAESHIEAYGMPPEHVTLKLRPADVQPFQVGHPGWFSAMTGERIGGQVYFGDYVYVRAQQDFIAFEGDYKILGIAWKQDGWNGLPYNVLELVPAVGGVSGTNVDEIEE